LKVSAWISALRLRTLPLALSTVGTGSFLAIHNNTFSWDVFSWAVITTVLLQILSNLANDYGDSQNGADSIYRVGPERAVQSGIISAREMRIGIFILVVLAFSSGIILLVQALGFPSLEFFAFLGIGILSIAAAYTYTAGKRPYGYYGFGDLMVLVFFGLVGVGGSYYLFSPKFQTGIILPAISLGLLATGVLNINNMRDIESDKKAAKITIPVRIGFARAKVYHTILLLTAVITALLYILLQEYSNLSLIFLLGIPLIFINLIKVNKTKIPALLDPLLRQLAIATFFFMLFFGLSIIL